MLGLEVFFSNLYPGIRVYTLPFAHIALGRSKGKFHTRIPLGPRDAARLVKTKFCMGHDSHGNPERKEIHLVTDANVLMVPKDKNELLKFGQKAEKIPLIVAPMHPNDDRVLVKWTVPSGFNGKAEIIIPKNVFKVAEDQCIFPEKHLVHAEALVVLGVGQKLACIRSGDDVHPTMRDGELTWDKGVLKIVFGNRESKTSVNRKDMDEAVNVSA